MSSLNTIFEMETGTTGHNPISELEQKRSTLKALNRRRDNIAAEIGYRVKDTISSYQLLTLKMNSSDWKKKSANSHGKSTD